MWTNHCHHCPSPFVRPASVSGVGLPFLLDSQGSKTVMYTTPLGISILLLVMHSPDRMATWCDEASAVVRCRARRAPLQSFPFVDLGFAPITPFSTASSAPSNGWAVPWLPNHVRYLWTAKLALGHQRFSLLAHHRTLFATLWPDCLNFSSSYSRPPSSVDYGLRTAFQGWVFRTKSSPCRLRLDANSMRPRTRLPSLSHQEGLMLLLLDGHSGAHGGSPSGFAPCAGFGPRGRPCGRLRCCMSVPLGP
jgi:hypothetical protein